MYKDGIGNFEFSDDKEYMIYDLAANEYKFSIESSYDFYH